MNEAICGKCGTRAMIAFKSMDYNRRLSAEEFSYYRCTSCELVFIDPIPVNLSKYYPEQYYDIPATKEILEERAISLQKWKLDALLKLGSKGRLLEVGAAYGLFSYLAKKSGFDVTAIEMDPNCCEYLRNILEIDVIESDDPVASLVSLPKFDVIALWQVLEHLPDPWAFLDAAAERIALNGVLVLDTPNPNAFQFSVLGRYWAHVDAPRHLNLIPVDILVEHLRNKGFVPILLTSSNDGANGFNGFGWAFSFGNFFRSELAVKGASLFGRFLAKLLIPIERTGWRGSTYTAAFRKEAER